MKNKTEKERTAIAKKAWRTRRLNALQRQYDAATTRGEKAAIKRQMNKV